MKGYGMKSVNEASWLEKVKPTAGPMDAILRPLALAPCSSDTHTLHGGSGEKVDTILGHEAIGEVMEVGALVSKFKVGDIVVVPCVTPNWEEKGVQNPRSNAHDSGLMGSFKFLAQKDGTMAEFFHVNNADANLVLLPEGVSMEAALMTVDMMSTGFHGIELAEVEFGDTVVVIGIGPVGLMAVAGAKLKGAARIIAVGTRPNCVKIAKEYGATDIVSYKEGDIVEQIVAMTGGGADKTIIAGGNQETFTQAIALTRECGVISNVNFFDVTETLAMPAYLWGLGLANKDIRGGFCPGGARRIERMLNMIKYGRIDTTKLVTHRFYGFAAIEDAFKMMDEKPADLIKPVIFIDWDKE
ncbi:threonine dehydrogenase-like Zn-dependent dehydrogenase [Enterococcus sp. PF1-24]|uniref:zinc-binding dehydrogenase n=1 Tax=unclassified Enterococcus TaxID=2608891 RepID=UPI002475BF6B|nr:MULTISPECIES: zinc-binding dehydrogenase [unclassified Enterococcus]MDH6365260.1 threonine dehydrogenase-like Zn-dependent dehydrogenase [Enterococcus sp. PFB1-1]MDH6402361.1 threonine dehydrogenase-like Zn-dependent dehydrogenase [Enterococcus sp. PF1-24]